MADTFYFFAIENVVGSHLDPEHLMHKHLHHVWVVVDSLHEHGLVSYHNPGLGEHIHCFLRLPANLFRVVVLGIEIDRIVLFKHLAKCRRDSLGEDAGHPRAQPFYLHVWNFIKFSQNPVQLSVAQGQSVSSCEKHISDLLVLPDVLQCLTQLGTGVDQIIVPYVFPP